MKGKHMTIWNIFNTPASSEQAPPVPTSMWETLNQNSIKPFAAPIVEGVRTFRGIKHGFVKPSERYSLVDPQALEQRRMAKVAQFQAAVEASVETELFFDWTFSKQEWSDVPAESGVRTNHLFTKTLKMGGIK
jgi:hypothetical protein